MPGYLFAKVVRISGSLVLATVGTQAKERRPCCKSIECWICDRPFSSSAKALRALIRSFSPSSVSDTLRVVLWNSATPTCSSSCLICMLTADIDRLVWSAALRKLAFSATERNTPSSLKLIFIVE